MKSKSLSFPEDFLWGTASAAYQVEGDSFNNQWYAWEQQGRTRGKAGKACGWWDGHWAGDFDRAAATGQNAHRLSVDWCRVQPQPGQWDDAAIEKYRAILRGARERGLTLLVTLHHFTDPLWIAENGGWENPETPALFDQYVRKAVPAFREFTNLWVTINEPNSLVLGGYVSGDMPPGKRDFRLAVKVLRNMALGHAAAYRTIHEFQPNALVSYAQHYRPMLPFRPWHPADRVLASVSHGMVNMGFPTAVKSGVMKTPFGNFRVPQVKNTLDYVGMNYYTSEAVKFDLSCPDRLFLRHFFPDGSDLSETGFIANTPRFFYRGLRWASRFFRGLPILVTENGTEDSADRTRPRYILSHLHQLWKAIADGCPVEGYFHWTLTDNYEWERGWTQKFGLWGLNRETQERIRRPSVDLYESVCRENALTERTVRRFCPELLGTVFPG